MPDMPTFTYHANLCACFSIDPRINADTTLSRLGWEAKMFDPGTVDTYCRFYYRNFVDFFMSAEGDAKIRTFEKNINRQIMVDGLPVMVHGITIYVMPYGIMAYQVKIEMQGDSLNDFTKVGFLLRTCDKWNDASLNNFKRLVIDPIREVANAFGYTNPNIVENGNKMKVFQIVTADNADAYGKNPDITLFEVGTLGRVGGYDEFSPDAPSKEYLHNILNGNKLSYYNNWTGLALFDTFTILGYAVKPWILETWESDYCSMIYMHSIYCKFYLFNLNTRFMKHPELGESLESEYQDFIHTCTFHPISFNFLPNEVDRAIDKSLGISEELTSLRQHISDYNVHQSARTSDRMDRILAFLSVVTILSTVWDGACLFNAIWPFTSLSLTETAGFGLVSSIAILIMVVVIIIMLHPRRKRI